MSHTNSQPEISSADKALLNNNEFSSSELIIFDWDGTLMDSHTYIIDTMELAAKGCGLAVPDRKSIGNIIGMSMDPAIRHLFPQLSEKQVDEFRDLYTEHYNIASRPQPELFEGVYEGLTWLKDQGYLLAIATGKRMPGLVSGLKYTQTEHLFTELRTADDCKSKPSPEMAESILASINVKPKSAIMVGDNVLDIQMGRAASVKSVGLVTGSSSADAMLKSGASFCFASFIEFLELFKT